MLSGLLKNHLHRQKHIHAREKKKTLNAMRQ